jgi:ketosteroid isomerase-like protein
MIRARSFRLFAAVSVGAAAVSCSRSNEQLRVNNIGEGGSGYTITRVPVEQPPPAPVAPLPPGDAKVHETGVSKAESAWMAALNVPSLPALDDLTEDRFVLVSPDGSMLAKDDFIALIRDGRLVVQSEMISGPSVVEYGNAAFITGVVNVHATQDGADISGSYRFADTWIWKSGAWKKAASVFLGLKE